MVCRLLAASAELTITVPVYVPAVSPAAFTATISVACELPEAGAPESSATDSQFAPELTAAVKEIAAPLLATLALCEIGAGSPICDENESVSGLASNDGWGAAVTVRTTARVCVVFATPGDVIVIVPAYVPAAKPAGSAEMLSEAGALPEAGDADSHGMSAETVNGNAAPLLPTFTVCAGGGVPPIWCVNVTKSGLGTSEGGGEGGGPGAAI